MRPNAHGRPGPPRHPPTDPGVRWPWSAAARRPGGVQRQGAAAAGWGLRRAGCLRVGGVGYSSAVGDGVLGDLERAGRRYSPTCGGARVHQVAFRGSQVSSGMDAGSQPGRILGRGVNWMDLVRTESLFDHVQVGAMVRRGRLVRLVDALDEGADATHASRMVASRTRRWSTTRCGVPKVGGGLARLARFLAGAASCREGAQAEYVSQTLSPEDMVAFCDVPPRVRPPRRLDPRAKLTWSPWPPSPRRGMSPSTTQCCSVTTAWTSSTWTSAVAVVGTGSSGRAVPPTVPVQ